MAAPNRRLLAVWENIAYRGLELLSRRGFGRTSPLAFVCRELLSERGEASGTALAHELAERYLKLTPALREAFLLSLLNKDYLPDPKVVTDAADQYRLRPNSETLNALITVAEPLRQELFRRINLAPGGTGVVIQMRTDLLKMLPRHPELKSVDADMRHLLASWFNRGFLHLERIDWTTPAFILEKLIEYEAVHAIDGWDDLRRRLASDRRCFAFFHPALPREPVIFIEIALTEGIASSVQTLLDRNSPPIDARRADTAVFYSITNCLEGLRGISFGNFLIKQVVAELEAEKLNVRTFVTLSPMPDMRKWWTNLPEARKAELVTAKERETLESNHPALMRLAAQYLLAERRGERALDPVAAFHLGNGASVQKIHFNGDCSEKGIAQSFGLMVSYRYRPHRLERNHEAYVKQGRIAASAEVRSLLPKSEPKSPPGQTPLVA
jgi:malonyl-CoA decarboxylase